MDGSCWFSGILLLLSIFISLFGEADGQWYKPWCRFVECCNDGWVIRDLDRLRSSLEGNLFGQHLVNGVVYGSLKGHTDYQPVKPLVLSFHGSTGTGKNYVSQWIAKSWFREGMNSQYVKVFSGTRDFPHAGDLSQYKQMLQSIIHKRTKYLCKHQIFIFDEIDSFPPGLLNSITSYLDYHEQINGVDFRNTIFIFLSNTGDAVLQDYVSDFYVRGYSREAIRLNEVEKALVPRIFSDEDKGLGKSRVIDSHLVSHFVPFLPLEQKHVRKCIVKEMQKFKDIPNSMKEDFIDRVLSELQFTGPNNNFSVKGCKNVAEKTNYVYVDQRRGSKTGKSEL